MARQPPAQPSNTARNAAIGVASAAPAITSAAGANAGLAVGLLGARKIVTNALKAIISVHARIATARITRLRDRLTSLGVPPDDIAAALAEEQQREKEFQRRATARVRAGLRLALAATDPSARAAGIEAVLRREQQYARQRAQASADRVYAATERESLRAVSPSGAYWQLGHATQHTPDCLAMAGRFWPWSVLNKVHPLLHPGCQCRLRSFGDAIAEGLMLPGDVPSEAEARQMAQPVIDYIERGHPLEEAAAEELQTRLQLLEAGVADRNALAALPLLADAELMEGGTNTGAMVALFPPAELATKLAIDKGERPDDLHVTLAFMGKAGGPKPRDAALAAVRAWAKKCPPLEGTISGAGQFVGGPAPVTYLSVDLPDLNAQREALVKGLDGAGTPVNRAHGFTPHMTLAYSKRRPPIDRAIPVKFEAVTLAWGDEHFTVPLTGQGSSA
jgi:2'-5' RNA ligase